MKSRKVLFSLALALVLMLCAGVAMAGTIEQAWNNATTAQTFTLSTNYTTNEKLDIKAPITIDLGGKTLTIGVVDNIMARNNNTVTFKNGTISVDGLVVGAGHDGFFHVAGYYGDTAGTLVLDNVDLIGTNYSSGAGVFRVWKDGHVKIINGSTVNLKNDNSSAGAFFKHDNSTNGLNAKLTIIESDVTLDDTVRGIQGGKVLIQDSTFTTKNMTDNVINSSATNYLLDLTIDNSTVNLMNGGSESSGLRLGGDSKITLMNGSKLDVGPHGKGAFNPRTNTADLFEGEIVLNGLGNSLAVDTSLDKLQDYIFFENVDPDAIVLVEDENGAFTVVTYVAPAVVPGSSASVPQTGDNSNIALWISLMAISALSFVALGRKSRFN